jgi:lipocalin
MGRLLDHRSRSGLQLRGRTAVVGEPARRYLWDLARESTLEEATYQGILERIEVQGYDPNNLVRTNQDSQ